jgi:peptide/nickel transport system permease protein
LGNQGGLPGEVPAAGVEVAVVAVVHEEELVDAVSPIIVATTLSVGNIILFESVLSFLGLGIQPPVASWGETIWTAPMLAVWPGLAIFVTVIAFNFLGDGLQDALDPRAVE